MYTGWYKADVWSTEHVPTTRHTQGVSDGLWYIIYMYTV